MDTDKDGHDNDRRPTMTLCLLCAQQGLQPSLQSGAYHPAATLPGRHYYHSCLMGEVISWEKSHAPARVMQHERATVQTQPSDPRAQTPSQERWASLMYWGVPCTPWWANPTHLLGSKKTAETDRKWPQSLWAEGGVICIEQSSSGLRGIRNHRRCCLENGNSDKQVLEHQWGSTISINRWIWWGYKSSDFL